MTPSGIDLDEYLWDKTENVKLSIEETALKKQKTGKDQDLEKRLSTLQCLIYSTLLPNVWHAIPTEVTGVPIMRILDMII